MKTRCMWLVVALLALQGTLGAQEVKARRVGVFIALCDNESQGIVPVPAKIGDGNKPDANLYWGCSEGFKGIFLKSADWTKVPNEQAATGPVMERITVKHRRENIVLVADAYRGTEIKQCLMDFERAQQEGKFQLSVYIGHNGLMDFDLPLPDGEKKGGREDSMILCCKSEGYFRERIELLGCRPVLLTTQFMYPGAFILHAALGPWIAGQDREKIRQAAASAYSKNQKISLRAASGVFSPLSPP